MNKLNSMVIWLSKPFTIAFFLTLYIVFVALVFPGLTNAMQNSATQNTPPIDLAFTYTVDEVYTWIEAYGAEGRKMYMRGEMTIDIIYPIIYTALLIGLLGFLTSYKKDPRFYGHRWLVVSPLSIWFFDLAENIGIVTMLSAFPEQLHNVAKFTSLATSLKWSCAGFVVITTLTMGAYRIFQYLRKQI